MAEELIISQISDKTEAYESIVPQIIALIEGENDLIANMANTTAALMAQFNHLWIGFYLVKNDQLVLGPFQGPIACTRIIKGRGVCGGAWENEKTIIVPDVSKFPGHIACSSLSNSEIVVPIIKNGEVMGVLDVDSTDFDQFDEIDAKYLEKIAAALIASI